MKPILSTLFILLSIQFAFAQRALVDGKLPKDLRITIDDTGTNRYEPSRWYQISAEGLVTYVVVNQGLPLGPRFADLLSLKSGVPSKTDDVSKSKTPKARRKDKRISRKQLVEIVREFESSGFFQMQERYESTIDHYSAKTISITANGTTKAVRFPVNYVNEALPRFLTLYDKIAKAIAQVESREISRESVPSR